MLRFTIRDALLLLVIVGLALGWWLDHRHLVLECDKQTSGRMGLLMRIAALEFFPQREKRIMEIFQAAQQATPTPEAAIEVFSTIKQEPDFRIRVRAMAVLPYLQQREQAIDVLLQVLRDNNKEHTGDGCVPLYAVYYLSKMKATRAKPDIQNWLDYLKSERPYDPQMMPILIEGAETRLAEFE